VTAGLRGISMKLAHFEDEASTDEVLKGNCPPMSARICTFVIRIRHEFVLNSLKPCMTFR